MRRNKLAILGAGGHGKVIAEAAAATGWSCIIFFDDAFPQSKCPYPWVVEGGSADMIERIREFDGVHIALGGNEAREEKIGFFGDFKDKLVTIIHPTAIVSSSANIGRGNAVLAATIIGPGATIEDGVILNSKSLVEHDCFVGELTHLCPNSNLLGGVRVGKRCFIGASSTVIQNVVIGSGSRIGAGSLVTKHLASFSSGAGVPYRPIEGLFHD